MNTLRDHSEIRQRALKRHSESVQRTFTSLAERSVVPESAIAIFNFFILRPLPPRPGKPEPIYQEIPTNGLKAPLAKEEEEEYDEAKYDDGEEKGFLQPRPPTPSSVTEEDEDGYLKPNFHR